VHPSLSGIVAWISAVGAAAAFADLDGDGRFDDYCYVSTPHDAVLVASLADRFAPFVLAADSAGYDPATIAPMGCVPADLNEDGRQDFLIYYWGRTPVAFLRRAAPDPQAPAATQFRAQAIGPRERWYTNAATLADVDGDGHQDLVIGNYFADGAHILDAAGTGRESMQDSMSHARNGGRDHLFVLEAGGSGPQPYVRFRDESGALPDPETLGWTLAVGAADLDGDLRPELYFANDFGPDTLLHNRSRNGHLELVPVTGRRGFRDPGSKVLGRDSFKGMGIDFGDVNGDGRLDLYVSNIAEEFALQESHFLFVSRDDPGAFTEGRAPYRDESESLGLARSGWGWESKLADFDNDGVLEAIQATGFRAGSVDRWPELHELAMANDLLTRLPAFWFSFRDGDGLSGDRPNSFFVRSPGGRFFDVAEEVGLGGRVVTRGIALADPDGDGDLDLLMANQWEPSTYVRNDCAPSGRFVGLRIVKRRDAPGPAAVEATRDAPSGRYSAAIGAAARLALPDGRALTAQVDGGNGHSGVRAPQIVLGVGDLDRPSFEVDVSWRGAEGSRQARVGLAPGWNWVVLPDER
jgi:hypothetical protein